MYDDKQTNEWMERREAEVVVGKKKKKKSQSAGVSTPRIA